MSTADGSCPVPIEARGGQVTDEPRTVWRRAMVAGFAVVALALATVASLRFGGASVPLADVWDAIRGIPTDPTSAEIVLQLRVPRTIAAIAVGGALAISGALLQSSLGNPLASPDIIGVTAGAAFGAMLVILVFPGIFALVPVFALFFGLVATALVFTMAWIGPRRGTVTKLVLSGIAVGALFTAACAGLMAIFPGRVQAAVQWLAGGLTSDGWTTLSTVWPYLLAGFVLAPFAIRPLDRLELGDEVAATLGAKPRVVRVYAATVAALLAAAAATLSGILGFIGIVVPHVVRLASGTSRHAYVIPVSAIGGAALLAATDTLARTVLAPHELPVGPFLAVIGVPLFLWLLRRAI